MNFNPSRKTEPCIYIQSVTGSRNSDGVNFIEAHQLAEALHLLVCEEGSLSVSHSIGVISPFRKQAEYLQSLISSKLSPDDIVRHNILVGTPYHFQGEERDYMYLSFAVCDQSKAAANYLNNENMFNVAITRAREKQYVYVSITGDSLNPRNLLARYLAHSYQAQQVETPALVDEFQRQVMAALTEKKIEVWPTYTVAHCTLDILCHFNGHYVGVDLVGYPGQYESSYTLLTYQTFRRAGLQVIPIEYGVWLNDSAGCIAVIANALHLVETALHH